MNNRNLAIKISKHPLIELLKKDKTIPKSVVARLIVEELMEAKPTQQDLEAAGQMSFSFDDDTNDRDNPTTNQEAEEEGDLLEDLAFYMGLAAAPISFIPGGGQLVGTGLSIGSDLLTGADIISDISKGNTGEATTKLMSIIGANIAAGLIPGGIAAKEGAEAATKASANAFAKTAGVLSEKLGKKISEKAVRAAVQKASKVGAKLVGGKIGEVVSKKAQEHAAEHAAKINKDKELKKNIFDQGKDILGNAWDSLKDTFGFGNPFEDLPGYKELNLKDEEEEIFVGLLKSLKNEGVLNEIRIKDFYNNIKDEEARSKLRKTVAAYMQKVIKEDPKKGKILLSIFKRDDIQSFILKNLKHKEKEPTTEPEGSKTNEQLQKIKKFQEFIEREKNKDKMFIKRSDGGYSKIRNVFYVPSIKSITDLGGDLPKEITDQSGWSDKIINRITGIRAESHYMVVFFEPEILKEELEQLKSKVFADETISSLTQSKVLVVEPPTTEPTTEPSSEETIQTSEDPKDYQPFVKASNNLINDFYRQKYKIQQARIVDAVIQSMKEFVDDDDKERAFQRTPDTTEETETLQEQEEKVEATEDQMRNIRIDIKSFLSRVNKTKEYLTAFEKVAKSGSVLGDAYKKRFIDNLKEIQIAVYRIALILNKILGPKQELDEAKESETLKKWKEVQGKYNQAAEAVNSLKELVATETPPTEIDQDLINDAYDSLVDLSQYFPSVSPFGKPQKGVEMDKVFEKYQLEFGAAIQAVKNSLQTSLSVIKLGEAGRESLQNARDGLRDFADEINTIFGVPSRFADAKVKPEDAKAEAVEGEAGVKDPEQKIQSIDPWAGKLTLPELPPEIIEKNKAEELISRVKEALKSSEDPAEVDDIIDDFKKDTELLPKEDEELIKWANKIKVLKETEKIAEEEIAKLQSSMEMEMDKTEIIQKVLKKGVEELEKTQISLKDPEKAAEELVYQVILDDDDFRTLISKIPQEPQKNPKSIIEKEEEKLKPLFSGEELKYAEEYAQAVYKYLKEKDRLGTWQEPKYKSDILRKMTSKNELFETEGDVIQKLELKTKEVQSIYDKLSDKAKEWKNKNIIKVEGEEKFGKLVLVLIDKKIIEKFQQENEPPTQSMLDPTQILNRFGFDNKELELIKRLKKFLDSAAEEVLGEGIPDNLKKLEIPENIAKKIEIFYKKLNYTEQKTFRKALEKAADLDDESKKEFYKFLGIPQKEKSDDNLDNTESGANDDTEVDNKSDDSKEKKEESSRGVEILREFFEYVKTQIPNKQKDLKENYMELARVFTDDRRDTGTWEGGTTLFQNIGEYIENNYEQDLIQKIIKNKPESSFWDKIVKRFTTTAGSSISQIKSKTGKALAEMFLNWEKYKPEQKKKVFEAWTTTNKKITEDIIETLVDNTLGKMYNKRDDVIAQDKEDTEKALEAMKRILTKFIEALKNNSDDKNPQVSESLIAGGMAALFTAGTLGAMKQVLGQSRQSFFDFQVKRLFLNTLAKYLKEKYKIKNASKIVFKTWKSEALSTEEKRALIKNYRKPLFRNPKLTGDTIQGIVDNIFENKEKNDSKRLEEKIANKLKPLIHEMLTKGK